MPTKLDNGVVVVNTTPHPLHFLGESGEIITAETDDVVNVIPSTETVKETDAYTLNTVKFLPSMEGKAVLRKYKDIAPGVLFVGSIIAAQAFPGQIVAPVPAVANRSDRPADGRRLMRNDRFTVFQNHNSKKED